MARMHSRKKGKAGSKRPSVKQKISWVRYKPKEIEMLILRLAKEGKTSSQIGMVLRDSYGIPDVKQVIGKRLSGLLAEKDILPKIPEDIMALIRKNIMIRKHMEKNTRDQPAARGLMLTDSKIRRLVKKYKSTGRLAADWNYDPDKIRLLIE